MNIYEGKLTEKSTETDTNKWNILFPQPGGTSLPRLGEQRDKHRQIKVQGQIHMKADKSTETDTI